MSFESMILANERQQSLTRRPKLQFIDCLQNDSVDVGLLDCVKSKALGCS